ncbi:MAG: type II toxin-antitoxin system VapC family toxin [Parvularculaceae bacterium]|nr:type II toxin-antitoxin system VapC family toxin [Parvularculaceae bacterium]
MRVLLDTHLILWSSIMTARLSPSARRLIDDAGGGVFFSAASLWEIGIKAQLGRADFDVDARRLRKGLLDDNWVEVAVSSEHAVAVADLPPIHKDPFDRLLIAQARVEGLTLLTSDARVAQYPGDIRKV